MTEDQEETVVAGFGPRLSILGAVLLFLWVPIGATLWVVSFWRPDVRDIAVWMLGIAGILTTAAALTLVSQLAVHYDSDEKDET